VEPSRAKTFSGAIEKMADASTLVSLRSVSMSYGGEKKPLAQLIATASGWFDAERNRA
jgi:hypothetical protein